MIDSLEWSGDSISLETPKLGREEVSVKPLQESLFDLPMIDDFADAVRAGREPICSAAAGLAVQQIIDAAFKSAQEGKHINL